MDKKISQLTAKGANLASTDLLEISEVITGGYASKYVTGAEVIASAQTGMQTELISGTNIKTINSTSLLGSGDVAVQPTLVSGTNIKTVNGNSLLGSGDLVISTGLTIGTTAIASGTVGRVLFEGTGNVVQESSNLFWDNTNSRLGIGTASPSALLHTVGSVTASGAIARGNYMQPTLVASANNDVMVGLDILPTFTNGSFTGVTNLALRATGQVRFNANGEVSSFQGYGTDILRIHSNGNGLLEIGQNLATPITTPPGKTTIYNRNNTYNALTISVTDGQIGYGSKIRWTNGLASGGAIYHSDAVLYDMGLQNQAGHYLHMFANGNVLLTNGTRSDAGYKLDVNGTARVQGKLSVNTPTAASAVMEVTSTTQGFLPPRMTNAQMVAIATPASGLMVYDTTNNKMCVYDGTAWQNLY